MKKENKNWNKRLLDIFFISIVIVYALTLTFTQRVLKASVNGVILSGDTMILRRVESFYLPLKQVAEELGYTIGWDEGSRSVMLDNAENHILMRIGELAYTKNGKSAVMNAKTFSQENRTYILLADCIEMLGCSYVWDEDNNTIVIKS